jgi:hypothetical protein
LYTDEIENNKNVQTTEMSRKNKKSRKGKKVENTFYRFSMNSNDPTHSHASQPDAKSLLIQFSKKRNICHPLKRKRKKM